MKPDIFRPIAFWKSACISMPDNSFFELLRSIFGKIKTPFNKQQLMDDLEKFLLSKEIQKTIAAYIDETEAKIIKAVAIFGEPAQQQLETFFSDELSYARLQDYIVNMEERFILYRFEEEKVNIHAPLKSRLALNPVLKNILLPITEDFSALFPASADKKTSSADSNSAGAKQAKTAINDLTLAALFSFVLKHEVFFRPENVIRRKIIEEAKTLFPGLDIKNAFSALQILGLFFADEEKLYPDRKRFSDFALLSARERMEYYAAALMIHASLTPPFEILPPLFRSKIRETVNYIHGFLDSLNADFLYPRKTLLKILEVIKARTGGHIEADMLFETLEKTGLIYMESGTTQLIQIDHKKNTEPVIAFDSASSVLVYPEIDFADAIKLAFILNFREISPSSSAPVARFELDKETAVRAFDNNIRADEIIELLKNLCGGKNQTKGLNEAFIWNLKDWEKRHGEVSLKRGLVLQLSQEHQYLTETKALSSLIAETLAPGVYFINENMMDGAAEILRKAGIDIISQRKNAGKEINETAVTGIGINYFSSPSSRDLPAMNVDTDSEENKNVPQNAGELTAAFHSMLEKMKLSDTEKNELGARIDRRLVLCESQLKDAEVRYEKLEARLMDYTGKQNIAKQAISQKSPVHITWQFKNKEKEMFGIPKSLDKIGNDLVLVINDTDGELLRIPLAKISLLRRIKKSIFEK